jgi:hypothetical protein
MEIDSKIMQKLKLGYNYLKITIIILLNNKQKYAYHEWTQEISAEEDFKKRNEILEVETSKNVCIPLSFRW